MLVLEVRKIDCQSLVFSFDKEGWEYFLAICEGLLGCIEHMHFLRGSELDEIPYSGKGYVVYDYLTITHMPEKMMKHALIAEDGYSAQGTGLELLFNQKGIDEFHRMILCAGKEGKAEMKVPHARLERNDIVVSDDCTITVTLQMIDIRPIEEISI